MASNHLVRHSDAIDEIVDGDMSPRMVRHEKRVKVGSNSSDKAREDSQRADSLQEKLDTAEYNLGLKIAEMEKQQQEATIALETQQSGSKNLGKDLQILSGIALPCEDDFSRHGVLSHDVEGVAGFHTKPLEWSLCHVLGNDIPASADYEGDLFRLMIQSEFSDAKADLLLRLWRHCDNKWYSRPQPKASVLVSVLAKVINGASPHSLCWVLSLFFYHNMIQFVTIPSADLLNSQLLKGDIDVRQGPRDNWLESLLEQSWHRNTPGAHGYAVGLDIIPKKGSNADHAVLRATNDSNIVMLCLSGMFHMLRKATTHR